MTKQFVGRPGTAPITFFRKRHYKSKQAQLIDFWNNSLKARIDEMGIKRIGFGELILCPYLSELRVTLLVKG